MNSVIPCSKGRECSWPACPVTCRGRPGGRPRRVTTIIVTCVEPAPMPRSHAWEAHYLEDEVLEIVDRGDIDRGHGPTPSAPVDDLAKRHPREGRPEEEC